MKRMQTLTLCLTSLLFLFSIQIVNAKQLPKLSVQLWSVKEDVKKDIDGTLQQLANMGFEGVEFAGEFGPYKDNPIALKKRLDELGLKGSGAHVSFEQLNEQNIYKTIAFYQTLGVKNLIVGWDVRAWAKDGVGEIVTELNAAAKRLAPYGMQTGFHNHEKEFNPFRASTFWDYIAKNTPKHVILQQDVGWTTYARKDPIEYVKRYPGRTLTTHYKAKLPPGTEGKLPIIGKDIINWPGLLQVNSTVGETKWIVVEQEDYPVGLTPMESVEASLKGLKGYMKD